MKIQDYERLGILPLEKVLPFIICVDKEVALRKQGYKFNSPEHAKLTDRTYLGQVIHMNSSRLQTFVRSGISCIVCDITGAFFAVEKAKNDESCQRYHLNLYAIDFNGKEVLMTKDHIIPRAKDGPNIQLNLQTMCYICNQKKGKSIGHFGELWVGSFK